MIVSKISKFNTFVMKLFFCRHTLPFLLLRIVVVSNNEECE